MDLRLCPLAFPMTEYREGATLEIPVAARQQQVGRLEAPSSVLRVGYLTTILVNVAMLVIANNLLSWGWAPFLTQDFNQLLWILNISFLATIVVNSIYLGYEEPWFKSATQIGLSSISMAVAIRTYQVFPFDFSGYEFHWEPLARFVIVLTMVAVGLAILSEAAKLVQGVRKASSQAQNDRIPHQGSLK
jgi:hypothetical protein